MSRKDKSGKKTARKPSPSLAARDWRSGAGNRPPNSRTGFFKRWQLQEAKAKFSEVFDRAVKEGPQVVTRRNKEAVVIVPEAEFRKLTNGPENPQSNMLRALLKCPKGPDLKISRQKDD